MDTGEKDIMTKVKNIKLKHICLGGTENFKAVMFKQGVSNCLVIPIDLVRLNKWTVGTKFVVSVEKISWVDEPRRKNAKR